MTSLVTRPTDTQMNVNIPFSDMTLPIQGPENPFGPRDRFLNQNALAGHVEEQASISATPSPVSAPPRSPPPIPSPSTSSPSTGT